MHAVIFAYFIIREISIFKKENILCKLNGINWLIAWQCERTSLLAVSFFPHCSTAPSKALDQAVRQRTRIDFDIVCSTLSCHWTSLNLTRRAFKLNQYFIDVSITLRFEHTHCPLWFQFTGRSNPRRVQIHIIICTYRKILDGCSGCLADVRYWIAACLTVVFHSRSNLSRHVAETAPALFSGTQWKFYFQFYLVR